MTGHPAKPSLGFALDRRSHGAADSCRRPSAYRDEIERLWSAGSLGLLNYCNDFQRTLLAYRYYGKRFDCGSKLGSLRATVAFALWHPEIGNSFGAYLRDHAARLGI
jgi:hypothetical protein